LFHGLDDVIGGRKRHHDGHVPCHVVVADEDVDLALLFVPLDGSICTSTHPKRLSWPEGVVAWFVTGFGPSHRKGGAS